MRTETPSIVGSVPPFWRDSSRVEHVGYVVGALLFTSGLLHAFLGKKR
jgi:hypothetical protein